MQAWHLKKSIASTLLVFLLKCAVACAVASAVQSPRSKVVVRLQMPTSGLVSTKFEKEFDSLIHAYNVEHSDTVIEVIHGGDNFSSLKEVITAKMAGSLPDLALVECTEIPALVPLKIISKVPDSWKKTLQLDDAGGQTKGLSSNSDLSIPFERVLPVLLINEDKILTDPKAAPTWKSVRTWNAVAEHGRAVSIPLLSGQGLWLLEAIAGIPIWKRTAGGLQANRELIPLLESLRKNDSSLGWDRSIQAFVGGDSPLLVTSIETLAYLASRLPFKWHALPLPRTRGEAGEPVTGSDWIILQPKPGPEILRFLTYLYSPEVAARWTLAGSFLPLRQSWSQTAQWREGISSMGDYPKLVQLIQKNKKFKPSSFRLTDRDVIQARSAWTQALHEIFLAPETDAPFNPMPLSDILTQLDHKLNSLKGDR